MRYLVHIVTAKDAVVLYRVPAEIAALRDAVGVRGRVAVQLAAGIAERAWPRTVTFTSFSVTPLYFGRILLTEKEWPVGK